MVACVEEVLAEDEGIEVESTMSKKEEEEEMKEK